MKKIFTLILCLMMTVSLIGCSNKKNEAVATVNGETITLGNYEKLLALIRPICIGQASSGLKK